MHDRTPTRADALLGMNKIGYTLAGQLEISPVSGKYSLFGKLFANYDFYAFGGLGAINYTADAVPNDKLHCSAQPTFLPNSTSPPSCPVTGIKVGPTFGAGFHTFLGDFVALNLEFRDIMVKNNASGRDTTGDGIVSDDDQSLTHNFMIGLGLTLFLPSDAHVSE
jgi:hypothetical protein